MEEWERRGKKIEAQILGNFPAQVDAAVITKNSG